MAQEKEKTVEVSIGEGDEAKKVNIVVKRPNSNVLNRANALFTKTLHHHMKDGIMTKPELEKFMLEKGIWSEEKSARQRELAKEIRDLTKDLFQGRGKRKLSEGKQLAIQIKKSRYELQSLIAEKLSLEQNTAESLADNLKFDFLVSECTYSADGRKKVYNNLEDYQDRSDDEIAFMAAATLAQMIYSLDSNFESQLPENVFLKKYELVDDNFNLTDREGHLVSLDGHKINEEGYYVNDSGQLVDIDGNPIDKDGNFIFSTEYVDEEKPAKKTRANGKQKESV